MTQREPTTDLAARYGTHRPVRRVVLLGAVVVLAVVSLGWLAWAAVSNSDPAVAAEVASFEVRDAHRVDATIEIRTRDADSRGTCLLRATADDHSIVGESTVAISARDGRRRAVQVRTEREATTVEVIRCTSAD